MFKQADSLGRRMKLGDFNTSKWLQKENINLDEVKDISRSYSDLKIFIIGEGATEGFYIYSQKHETCFKFEAELSLLK
jgi:hypothetical protein